MWRAGGSSSLGNRAEYQAPPGTHAFDENEASDGESSGTDTIFSAVYVEGAWRITDRGE